MVTEQFVIDFLGRCDIFRNFLNADAHLLVDATNFPNIRIEIHDPRDICPNIPTLEIFQEYAKFISRREICVVFLSYNLVAINLINDRSEDDEYDEATELMDRYIAAYKNGLVKEAYNRANLTNSPVIFGVIDGEVRLLDREDVMCLFDIHKELGDYNTWLENCVNDNSSKVSYLFVDQAKSKFLYCPLPSE